MESSLLKSPDILLSPHEAFAVKKRASDVPLEQMIGQNRAAVEVLSGASRPDIHGGRARLEAFIAEQQVAELGPVVQRNDIRSTLSPFQYLPEYRISYPEAVVQAMGALYTEYNEAFSSLVAANREQRRDYQYCFENGGTPLNYFVQVDMVGLPDAFLRDAEHFDAGTLKDVLRSSIFEIENSVAMYQFLSNIFAYPERPSMFGLRFRECLEQLRNRHHRPIALLAVTEEKVRAMSGSEFGVEDGTALSDEEVRRLSGFDRFFGPAEFQQHVAEQGGACHYLLYVRSSDPASKLRNPQEVVRHPLLEDPALRRIIKENALTFNIDDPRSGFERRINDTKEYLETMGMGYAVRSLTDLLSPALMDHLQRGKGFKEFAGEHFTRGFSRYLQSHGVDSSSDPHVRGKPMKGAFGCYGHLSGHLSDGKLRSALKKNLGSRGAYIFQPERRNPSILNASNGVYYQYIDRVFLGFMDDRPRFLGGFRSLLPATSVEAMNGRNHGSRETVFTEIQDAQAFASFS